MSHGFVDQMLEKSKVGELRSPVLRRWECVWWTSDDRRGRVEMEALEELGNPLGVIQGGVATALADAAMAAAATTILDDEEISAQRDHDDRHLRAPHPSGELRRSGRARAEARVIRAGRAVDVAEPDVLADGDLVGNFASARCRSFDPAAYVAKRGAYPMMSRSLM